MLSASPNPLHSWLFLASICNSSNSCKCKGIVSVVHFCHFNSTLRQAPQVLPALPLSCPPHYIHLSTTWRVMVAELFKSFSLGFLTKHVYLPVSLKSRSLSRMEMLFVFSLVEPSRVMRSSSFTLTLGSDLSFFTIPSIS